VVKAFGLLVGLTAVGVDSALTAGSRVLRASVPVAEIAVGAAGELVASTARAAADGVTTAIGSLNRACGGVRDAALGGSRCWPAGSQLQVPLCPHPDNGPVDAKAWCAAAEQVALAVAEHPGVTASAWDADLGRLVLEVSAEASTAGLLAAVIEHAAPVGLTATVSTDDAASDSDTEVTAGAGPGAPGRGGAAARTAATSLLFDAFGVGAALAGRASWRRRSPEETAAVATLLREDPRLVAALRRRLGNHATELLLAAVNAAAYGLGQSPTALLLDAGLRGIQLAEATARVAAGRAAAASADGRAHIALGEVRRPRRQALAGESYAGTATVTSVLAAAATLLAKRDFSQAARAVLAGSPKAARYGPTAFTAALGCALARAGVLVGDVQRLGLLERVDTVVLHAGALRAAERVVLQASPTAAGWDTDRLWQAATRALRTAEDNRSGSGTDLDQDAVGPNGRDTGLLALEPATADATGRLVARVGGRKVGTVEVGWAVDAWADPVLNAARHAGLRVVVAGGTAVGEFAALADEVHDDHTPLPVVVRELQDAGGVVLTVARCDATAGPDGDAQLLAGLLGSDLAVAVADREGALVWDADVVAVHGLPGVWRLLTAAPAAAAVGRQSTVLAQAGTTLAGLLLLTGQSRWRLGRMAPGVLLGPVNVATALAVLVGVQAAVRVATAATPLARPRLPWHTLDPEQALTALAPVVTPPRSSMSVLVSRGRGLVRTAAHHPLLAPARATVGLATAVGAELNDPLVPVLAVGAAASAVLGSTVDAVLVAAAMGMNALVGGAQRVRAERALAGLAAGQRRRARRVTLDPHATATDSENGTKHRLAAALTAPTVGVDAGDLRPGDVIALEAGDVVPADARLLQLHDLEVDESSLTGESLPVSKQLAATPSATVAERHCMVFEGTTIVAGWARAVVVGTGEQTEAGRAASLAGRTPPPAGVQARLQELTGKALPWTAAGGALVTGLSLLRGQSLRQAIGGGVAVAVAAVPEGLPLVATVAQMAAARRLSSQGVLVRSPRVLEALGRVDTVCFDKTGTLTENQLRVVRLATPDGHACPVDNPTGVRLLAAAARACPTADGDPTRHAHATDEAVLAAAPREAGWRSVAGRPFEASRGYAIATGTDEPSGQTLLVVKGAPEVVLTACPDAEGGMAVTEALAADGLRVLAVAQRPVTGQEAAEAVDKPLEGLQLLGFLALADTARESSAALVTGLRTAGAQPVMLTGDHPHTARAIAATLGWPTDTVVITGEELAALDRDGQAEALQDAGVIARVAPEQKLQVIEALRATGRVVAMVGDGANDAAAIRAADVGIGIAARGSAAARHAADLVITGEDLAPLLPALTEGRTLWRSVTDAVSILLGGNAGEVGFTVAGTLFSGTPPLSARQLLLVNLLTDMFPAMAVATTPPTDHPTGPPAPDGAHGPVGIAALGTPLTNQIRRRGIVTGLGATTAWLAGQLTPGSARRTSTMALCGVVGTQLTQTLIGRTRSPLVLATTLGSAATLMAIVQTPLVSHFFGCTPLGPVAWSGVATAITTATLGSRLLPDDQPSPGH